MSELPTDLQYTAEHEWVRAGEPVTVGITAHAAQALGDIVYVDLPEVGAEVTAGEVCGEIESTKSVSEIYSPVTGTVAEVNVALSSDASAVNADPYGDGWLLRIDVTATGTLLSAEEYAALVD